MSASDVFLLAVRWLHLLAAAAWVGGSVFYLLVIRPALRRMPEPSRSLNAATAGEYQALVNACIAVLVATGVILGLNRLTVGAADSAYAVTLGFKSILSVWMFLLVQAQRRQARLLKRFREETAPPASRLRRFSQAVSGYNALVVLGLIVFLLSDLLKVLFELALSRG